MHYTSLLFSCLVFLPAFTLFASEPHGSGHNTAKIVQRSDTSFVPGFANTIKGYEWKGTIEGDFNGDGRKEKAWLVSDYLACETTLSNKDCRGIIRFSGEGIPTLTASYLPFGLVHNEGDLNDDGSDEIGILPGWFKSSCREYTVYTLRNKKWVKLFSPIHTTESLRAKGIKLVEKVPGKKGFVRIRYSGDCCCQCECTKEKILKLQ